MVFKLARTFAKPAAGANAQRGFPEPGAGAQTSGDYEPEPAVVPWQSEHPTKGRRTFLDILFGANEQRGFPDPLSDNQRRAKGEMPNTAIVDGLPVPVYTPYFSRGAAAYVQNYGKVLTNPIGAGVVAMNRPQASYGPAGVYQAGQVFWTSQAVPTSVNLTGLTSPAQLEALLGNINVQAVVRTQ